MKQLSLFLAATSIVGLITNTQIYAATLYVSQTSPSPTPPYSTPQTAAHNIQDAVDVATEGDTVQVAPGDYGVTNQITVTNAIRLQSTGGASQTFVIGNAIINQGLWCLAISNAVAVADGFTFRRGTGDPGGAILAGGTIQNCNFTNFYVSFGSIVMSGGTVSNVVVTYVREPDGAAVHCSDSGLITDSLIMGHGPVGIGGTGIDLVNSRLQNSVISGTQAAPNTHGVAVSALSSTVVGCIISNNYNRGKGGGAYLENSLMDRCIITGNASGGDGPGFGGGGIFETNSIVRNSLIVSNSVVIGDGGETIGGFGGGIYMQGGSLVNCTVSGNSTADESSLRGYGGGVFAESGGITNCIIYFNSFSPSSHPDNASTNWFNVGPAVFDHCCTAPDPGGAGNITQNPQFADMANGNFHLASTSPCIDAGVVQPWMTNAQDLDGNPRVSGASVDIGAYESQATLPRSILSISRSGSNIILLWPSTDTSDLALQQSSKLTTPESWAPSTATVNDDGTNKTVTLPVNGGVQFFRLHKL
jgi:hypothetical protein